MSDARQNDVGACGENGGMTEPTTRDRSSLGGSPSVTGERAAPPSPAPRPSLGPRPSIGPRPSGATGPGAAPRPSGAGRPGDTFADRDLAYRAVSSRDPRFDGRLYVGVLSTGVFCRPSCPSRTPRPESCVFHRSAAACVAAGFRACRRCRPDAQPGTRDWDVDADLAGRALRLLESGVVDDEGVAGLARRLSVSPRHLQRVLVAQLGAGPADLARTRRAQVARLLVEETSLPMADVAFAAGFRSVRQFNEVMRTHLGRPPSELRRPTGARVAPSAGRRAHPDGPNPSADDPGTLEVRLRHRGPLDAGAWLEHVAARAVPGVEEVVDGVVRRVLPGRAGPVLASLTVTPAGAAARLALPDLGELTRAVGRLRGWADLDADPARVDEVLAADPRLAPLVAARPGLRVPGSVDGGELAVRAVLGQQVSVAAARTLTGRLVAALGEPTPWGLRSFPTPAALRSAGVDRLRAVGLTEARALSLHALAAALDEGLDLGPGADREVARAALAALPGVGPWTVEYVALRALGDPDAFPAHDLVLRRVLGVSDAREAAARAERWRPWRGYAAQHLWTSAKEDR